MRDMKDFLKPEERDGFNVSLKRKQVWKIELDMFEAFIQICENHGLNYYILGGTLLGGVRHKGFIPWDDDIDVGMMRDDYEKFIKFAKTELSDRFFLQTVETDEDYYYGITKIRANNTSAILYSEWEQQFPFHQGIFFDIFPIDAVPDSEIMRKIHKFLVRLTNSIARSSAINLKLMTRFSLLHKISFVFFRILLFFIKPITFAKWRDKIVTWYNDKNTKKCGFISQLYRIDNGIWDRSDFEEIMEIPFEYLVVKAPKNYDNILTHSYGDWRTPVRVEDISDNTFMHTGTWFDVNNSYEKYIREYEQYKNVNPTL